MSHDAGAPGDSLPTETVAGAASPYVVVARRYRPKSFDDLVGQQQIVQALMNAITTQRVGHAYLFTGARGVGKTSSARIFAKALNSPGGPTPNPDNDSDISRAIDAGEDVDVIEIDGASNRGIDEIRQLRSNANVRPSRARFKIYIIDEVHMLTTAAFNALLKTLEEPPQHVKFILCTTDPQKIPITVLSRCQRYDFAPVDLPSIVRRLQHIVDTEGRTADLEALQILARRAEGSMRDSQSLLEQLLSYCSECIRVEDVHRMLGTAASGRLADLTEKLLERQAAGALQALDEAITQGVDCGQLAEQLLGYFRDLMAVTVGGTVEILRYTSASQYETLRAAGERFGLATALAAFEILDQSVSRMRQSTQPRTLLEIAVVRICHLENLQDLSNLIERLRHDEGGRGPAKGPGPGPSPGPGPGRVAAPTAPPPSVERGPEKKKADVGETPPPASSTPPTATPLTRDSADRIWKQVLEELGDMTADFAGCYDHIAISAPDSLVVHFREAYTLHKESCEQPDRKAQLERGLARLVGRPVRIQMAVIPDARGPVANSPVPTTLQIKREKESNPFVRQALDLFDAEVIRVDLPRPTPVPAATGEKKTIGPPTTGSGSESDHV